MNFKYGKREANLIKGIALIMMFAHHLFGFRSWILEENMYQGLVYHGKIIEQLIATFFKLCVGLFSFTTGYAMFVQKDKYSRFSYCVKKAVTFLIHYWVIFAVFLIVGVMIHEPLPGLCRLIQQCFGLCTATGFDKRYWVTIHPIFAWYVSFHLIFLLLHPLLRKLSKWNFWFDTLVYFVVLHGTYIFLVKQPYITIHPNLYDIAKRFALWGMIGMLGYLFAKYQIFERLDSLIRRWLSQPLILILGFLAVLGMFYARYKGGAYIKYAISYDTLYVPFLIYIIVTYLNAIHCSVLEKVLMLLSRHSMNMWFLHALFFTPNYKLQWIAYFPKYPILILLWTLFLMLLCSMLIEKMKSGVVSFFRKKILQNN